MSVSMQQILCRPKALKLHCLPELARYLSTGSSFRMIPTSFEARHKCSSAFPNKDSTSSENFHFSLRNRGCSAVALGTTFTIYTSVSTKIRQLHSVLSKSYILLISFLLPGYLVQNLFVILRYIMQPQCIFFSLSENHTFSQDPKPSKTSLKNIRNRGQDKSSLPAAAPKAEMLRVYISSRVEKQVPENPVIPITASSSPDSFWTSSSSECSSPMDPFQTSSLHRTPARLPDLSP